MPKTHTHTHTPTPTGGLGQVDSRWETNCLISAYAKVGRPLEAARSPQPSFRVVTSSVYVLRPSL